MSLSAEVAILRSIPVPLVVSTIAGLITLLTPLAPYAAWITTAVGALTFAEKLLVTYENDMLLTVSTPPPAPPKPKFKLAITPLTAKIGDNVTYSVSGGTPSGTWHLFDDSGTTVSGALQLDANGNGTYTAQLTTQGVIGDELQQDGQVDLYAVDDTTDTDSATVTLT